MSDDIKKNLPSLSEYLESAKDNSCLPEKLKGFIFEPNKKGGPFSINTCGTACIFKIFNNKTKKKYALKCYRGGTSISFDDLKEIQLKLESFNLQTDKLPFLVKYDFFSGDDGIQIEKTDVEKNSTVKEKYPFTLSEWVEGKNIIDFLYSENDKKVKNIALKLLDVFQKMRENGFIHSDLSHTNIIVTPQNEIKLIDLDFSTIINKPENINLKLLAKGHANFQHIIRSSGNTDYTESEIKELDNYSEWIIILTVLVRLLDKKTYIEHLAERIKIDKEDEDNKVLFSVMDYKEWSEGSDIRNKIKKIQNSKFQEFLTEFTDRCQPNVISAREKFNLGNIPELNFNLCREIINAVVVPNPVALLLGSLFSAFKDHKKIAISLVIVLTLVLTVIFLPPAGIPDNLVNLKKKFGIMPQPLNPPTFMPEQGTFPVQQNVIVTSDVEGAVIKYTIDGSDPESTSLDYEKPIAVVNNMTIKAKAVKEGETDSEIVTAEYIIQKITPEKRPDPAVPPKKPQPLPGPRPQTDPLKEYQAARKSSDNDTIIRLGPELMQKDPSNALNYEEDIAWAYANKGNIPEAEKRLDVLIDKLKTGGNKKKVEDLFKKIIDNKSASSFSSKLFLKISDVAEQDNLIDIVLKASDKLLNSKLTPAEKAGIYEKLGKIYISTSQPEIALKYLKDALSIFETQKNNEKVKELIKRLVDIRHDLAVKKIEAGKEPEAIMLLDDNINEIKDKKEKFEYLKEILELKFKDNSSVIFLVKFADHFKNENNFNEEIMSLQKAAALDNSNPEIFERLGDLFSIKESDKEAKENFEKALKLFESINDTTSVKRVQDKMNPLPPGPVEPEKTEETLIEIDKPQPAADDIVDPLFTGIVLQNINGKLYKKCRVKEFEITGKMIRPIGGPLDNAYKKASAAYNRANYEEAMEQYCNALKYRRDIFNKLKNGEPFDILNASRQVDHKDINIINDIGCIYAVYGEDDWAVTFFNWAIELDPKFKLAYLNLFNLYLHIGQLGPAKDVKNRFEKLGHTDYEAKITLTHMAYKLAKENQKKCIHCPVGAH